MLMVAFLRAVNVGGTGMLKMEALKALASEAGLLDVRTVGQSGNLVFETAMDEAAAASRLAASLRTHMEAPVTVVIRPRSALRGVVEANPFPAADPAKIGVVFTASPPPDEAATEAAGPGGEALRIVAGTLFVHYPDGIGRSRLVLPTWARAGTTRNLRTVTRLAAS